MKKSIRLEEKREEKLDEDGFLDILDNKQLLKKVLREGDKNSARPERGCRVTINLKTRLKGSDKLIDSHTGDKLQIFVGDYDTIHGIDLAIPLMHNGEIANVVIAPRFGYGSLGCEPDIPPDSTLDCIVELVDCEWMGEEIELPIEERLKIGTEKKNRGNFWHSREEYSISGQCYKRALDFLDVRDEEMQQRSEGSGESNLISKLIELKTTTYNNLAAVHLKTEAYDAALKAVNSALMLEERNVKALFRKGKILGILGEYGEAVDILRAALKFDPENKAIQVELSKLLSMRKKQLANEKVMYRRMLQLDKSNASKPSKFNSLLKWSVAAAGVATAVGVVAYYINQ
ncbi:FK506-binding-like protein 1 [Dinothrombium tinctorium]|uniref:peptidylprolyl isomerase n=1 Tax=Dinothrombium tinctorium TaxID=1965070 RepID=A0A3S3PL60_9ACAR|nr:FK506-binding-like protein 1 [Dinothrombium tinctorium]RWS17586.1 FK506-binding-like protein 1 [Dinothrombium tinctorium]RWS17738.1 FK506-binding-like protein 1 [Dinothrombium tinctorium]